MTGSKLPWRQYLPALVVGGLCIIAGGLVSAITSAVPFDHGSWVAAYLVLVAGAAQIGLAVGQALLARHPVGRGVLLVQFVAWNLGSALVIAGTFWGQPLVVDLGGTLLALTLAALLHALRGSTDRAAGKRWRVVTSVVVRSLVGLLFVSIPVGLWLAHLRAP